MPLRHVVMFKWEAHVDADHVAKISARLSALPAEIDVIKSYVHGSDIGFSEGAFDYVVVADFDNVNDFRTYREHPQHVLMIEELVTGNVAERAAIQFQTGPR